MLKIKSVTMFVDPIAATYTVGSMGVQEIYIDDFKVTITYESNNVKVYGGVPYVFDQELVTE